MTNIRVCPYILIYKFTRKLINKYILIPHNLGDDVEFSRVSISNLEKGNIYWLDFLLNKIKMCKITNKLTILWIECRNYSIKKNVVVDLTRGDKLTRIM